LKGRNAEVPCEECQARGAWDHHEGRDHHEAESAWHVT
jgi:hypothetical protein